VKTTRKPSETHFSQQNKKKTQENAHRTQENDFFEICLVMRFHTAHHIYKFALRKKVFEKKNS